jgi:DNA-binding MarR family transcriptional regulator
MQQADAFVVTLHKWIGVFMQSSVRDMMSYARESGLSMPQLGALFQIRHRGSSGITDLGDDLGVTSSAASQMLERMVQQRLILRSEDPSDRRVKLIVLTEKGSQILQGSIRALRGSLSDLSGALSDSEKEQIIVALNILIEKSNPLRPPVEPGARLCQEEQP